MYFRNTFVRKYFRKYTYTYSTICIRILFRIYFRKYMYVYVYSKCTVIVTFDGTFVPSRYNIRKYFRKYSILSVRRYLRTKGYIATYSTYGNTEIDEKNTIQRFFWFDPAILAFPVKMPIHYSPRTTSAYSLGSNFSRLKGVPAGVRALLESRERHERRRRTRRIYSKYHDAPAQSKISHQSL